MIDDLDLHTLRDIPEIRYYFRYELHRGDFHDLRYHGRLYGHYAAKPLYGRLTPEGRVDKSKGFNGDIAALFLPVRGKTARDIRLLLTHTAPEKIVTAAGARNWDNINKAAKRRIKRLIAAGWLA